MLKRTDHRTGLAALVSVASITAAMSTGNCSTFSEAQDPGEGEGASAGEGGSTSSGGNGGATSTGGKYGGGGSGGGYGGGGFGGGGTGGGTGGKATGGYSGGQGGSSAAGGTSGTAGTTSGGSAGSQGGTANTGGAGGTAGAAGGTGGVAGAPVPGSPVDLCLKAVNAHRASVPVADYARWASGESCASDQAQAVQGGATSPDLKACGAWAGTICPGWPGPPESMITKCIDQMWDDPGSKTYMASATYKEMACGFYVAPGGDVWALQMYR